MYKKFIAILLSMAMMLMSMPTMLFAASTTECAGGGECMHEAAIGSTHYDTISEAITAASESDDIYLLKDATCNAKITKNVHITEAAGSDFTLTMGTSKTISAGTYDCKVVSTASTKSTVYTSGATFNKDFVAKCRINDGTFNGKVTSGTSAVYIADGNFTKEVNGIFNINKGTFGSTVGGDVTIMGGTFSGAVTTTKGISGGSFTASVSTTSTISGGEFKSTATAGTLSGGAFSVEPVGTLKDGYSKISNEASTKWMVTQTANVSSGKLVTGSFAKYYGVSEFADTVSHAVLTSNTSKDYVVLKDDVNNGKLYKGIYKFSISNVAAEGYEIYTVRPFGSTEFVYDYIVGKNATIDNYNIVEGTFLNDPSVYVDTNTYNVKNNSGEYTISIKDSAVVASIGDKKYPSIEKALNAATSGQTIKLLKDIEGNVELDGGNSTLKAVTLDLNGHSITATSGVALKVQRMDLTIVGESASSKIVSAETAIYLGGSIYSKANLTIKSGTIEGTTNAIEMAACNASTSYKVTTTISGGTIKGGIVNTKNGALVLAGGTFNVNPEDWETFTTYAEGKGLSDEGNNTWKVKPIIYNVTVVPASNGTVSVDMTSADAGSTITVTATPDEDYKLKEILLDGEAITGNTFKLTKNVEVTATFIAKDYCFQNTSTGEKFETLTEASVVAASGNTIKMLKSAGFTTTQKIEKKRLVLDLNGKTLSLTNDGNNKAQLDLEGEITVKNGTINSEHNYAVSTSCFNPTNYSFEQSKITFTKVTMNAGINLYLTDLIVNNCNIDASEKEYYAIWASEGFGEKNCKVIINGGKYTAGVQATLNRADNDQKFVVNGGYFGTKPEANMLPADFGSMTNDGSEVDNQKYPYFAGYVVKFVDDETTQTKMVNYKETISKSSVNEPTKPGFEFAGWFNGDKQYFFSNPVTSSGTYTATFRSTDNNDNVIITKSDKEIKASADVEKKDVPMTSDEIQKISDGETLKVVLDVAKLETTKAAKTNDAKLIKKTIRENDLKLGTYIDISMFKQMYFEDGKADGNRVQISETLNPVAIEITIPQNLRVKDRIYSIIRVHNNVSEIIFTGEADEEWNISFETDKFSTYAIAYSDENVEKGNATVKTGDSNQLFLYIGLFAIMLLGLCALIFAKVKSRKK